MKERSMFRPSICPSGKQFNYLLIVCQGLKTEPRIQKKMLLLSLKGLKCSRGYTSVAECLRSIYKALGSIPSIKMNKKYELNGVYP